MTFTKSEADRYVFAYARLRRTVELYLEGAADKGFLEAQYAEIKKDLHAQLDAESSRTR